MFMFCFWALLPLTDVDAVQTLKTYETPEEEYLVTPVAMTFSSDGKLFVLDRNQCRVLVWRADGTFSHAFGKKGQGPGEMRSPANIATYQDDVYIWDSSRKMLRFHADGQFVSDFRITGIRPRAFGLLREDLFLLGHLVEEPKASHNYFDLVDNQGKKVSRFRSFLNESQLTPAAGESTLVSKPYGPEVDIQRLANGRLLCGFSQNRDLFELDADGNLVKEYRHEVPASVPTEQEKADFLTLNSLSEDGGRLRLSDEPGIRFEWNHAKAFYTNFTVVGDKIVFVLGPHGTTSLLNGYSFGSYYICSLADGKPLRRGAFHYPDDSRVFLRDGRILLCELRDDYVVREITFGGL